MVGHQSGLAYINNRGRSSFGKSQVKLDTQQPPPFLLAARDDEKGV
jgi:hypothetical protein